MIPDNLLTDARAKIIWGDDPASVHCFLTQNGLSAAEADDKIREFMLDRNAEIRKIGIRNIILGGGVICIAGYVFYSVFGTTDRGVHNNAGKACGGAALMVLYGIWKLVDGICRLVRPKSEHGSIPDISD